MGDQRSPDPGQQKQESEWCQGIEHSTDVQEKTVYMWMSLSPQDMVSLHWTATEHLKLKRKYEK